MTSDSLLEDDQLVVTALSEIGINVESIYDLVNSRLPYREALPALLKILPMITDDHIREGIVRALAVKKAGDEVARVLIEEFKNIPPEDRWRQNFKWAVGNSLAEVAGDAVFEDIVALAEDARHGKAREMVAVALGNMKDPKAVSVLLRLLDDEMVAGHAAMALGKLKAKKAEARLTRLAKDDPREWVRKAASRALAKIQKAKLRE